MTQPARVSRGGEPGGEIAKLPRMLWQSSSVLRRPGGGRRGDAACPRRLDPPSPHCPLPKRPFIYAARYFPQCPAGTVRTRPATLASAKARALSFQVPDLIGSGHLAPK